MVKELLILDFQKPDDKGEIQKPTQDIPTGKSDIELGDSYVKSSLKPDEIQQALDQLS